MIRNATSAELSRALSEHLAITKEQIVRLDGIFAELGESSRGKKCKGMEGLLEEGSELLEENADPEVLDAGIIAAAQRVEHYEIAAYGTARAYAALLGDSNGERLLDQTATEEGDADKTLTQIALSTVNLSAVDGGASRASLARGSKPLARQRKRPAAKR